MSFKIFDLKHVPEEEEHQLKSLLRSKRIHYYETPKGRHSNPAIWVKKKTEAAKARKVINDFQDKWRENARNHKTTTRPPKDIRFRIIFFIVALTLTFALFSPFL